MNPLRNLVCCLCLCAVTLSCGDDKTIFIPFDESVQDYSPLVARIIADNPEGGFRLVFEKKEYPFFPDSLTGKYMTVSNNDNGVKRVAFDLKDKRDIEIDGRGAVFLFHGGMVPFAASGCERISLRRFTVDYKDHFTLEGTVTETDPEKGSFTLRIREDNPYRISGDTLYFQGYDWELPLGENIVFDPSTRRPFYETSAFEHWADKSLHAEELSPGLVRFSSVYSRKLPPVGGIWVDKGPHGQNRRFPGIIISESKGINIENVSVRHCGAMAFIAQNSSDIRLYGFSTAQKKDCDRMVTASADATHFVDCSGSIELVNCAFECMLDDASNVHGTYMTVDKFPDIRHLEASFRHFQQEGNLFAEPGDTIRFIDRTSLSPVVTKVIRTIERQGENRYVLETDSDMPEELLSGNLAIENISNRISKVLIRNCSVRFNRARSFLLSCGGNVVVENCDLSSMMAGIRVCGDANYWFESGPTDRIIIRNNRFRDLAIGGASPQAILQIDPVVPAETRKVGSYYHRNVLFENNLVETFDRQIIYAMGVDTLTIKGNRFTDSRSFEPLFPDLSTIDVQYCGLITIDGNDFRRWNDPASVSIHHCEVAKIEHGFKITDHPNPFFYQN